MDRMTDMQFKAFLKEIVSDLEDILIALQKKNAFEGAS